MPLQPNGTYLHMAATTASPQESLLGAAPLGSASRGTWSYAYTLNGCARFDTFSQDAFRHGALKHTGFNWDNYCDIRSSYLGMDIARNTDILTVRDLCSSYIDRTSNPRRRPICNLGNVRAIITASPSILPAGGSTEHIFLSENGMVIRLVLQERQRAEFLCHLQSTSQLPSHPTCDVPLIATVRETFKAARFVESPLESDYADRIGLQYQMMESARDEEAATGDKLRGFRIRMPNATVATMRLGEDELATPIDLRKRAVENFINLCDLSDTARDPPSNPLLERATLPL